VRNTFIHYDDREEDEQPDIDKYVSNLLDGMPSDWSKNERLSDHIEGIAQGYRIRRSSSLKSQEAFVESPPVIFTAAGSSDDQLWSSPSFSADKEDHQAEEARLQALDEQIERLTIANQQELAEDGFFTPNSKAEFVIEFPPVTPVAASVVECPPRSGPLKYHEVLVESPPVSPVASQSKHNKMQPGRSSNFSTNKEDRHHPEKSWGSTTEAVDSEAKKTKAALPSAGSASHGEGTCKPCAWHWKPGGCLKGSECSHCHICGKSVLKKKRKDRLARIKDRRRALAEAEVKDAKAANSPEMEDDHDQDAGSGFSDDPDLAL